MLCSLLYYHKTIRPDPKFITIAYEKQLQYDVTVTVAALPHTVVAIWVPITSAPVHFLVVWDKSMLIITKR